MTARGRKAPPQPAAAESVIYQGRAAVGSILVVRKEDRTRGYGRDSR